MANSYVNYTGNGSTTDFAVPFPYLDKSHVTVLVAGVSTAFTWVNDGTVRVSPAPAVDATVKVQRNTPITAITSFANNNNLTAENLNDAMLQALFVAVEATDVAAATAAASIVDDVAQADADAAAAASSATAAAASATAAAASAVDAAASAATINTTAFARKDQNLADLVSASTARTNLGLGNAATKNTGTTTGTVAAGDDSRFSTPAQKSANLSDLASASAARTNLGLGDAATKTTGTASGNVPVLDGSGKLATSTLPAGLVTAASYSGGPIYPVGTVLSGLRAGFGDTAGVARAGSDLSGFGVTHTFDGTSNTYFFNTRSLNATGTWMCLVAGNDDWGGSVYVRIA